jgi:hypothetical protein
MPAPFDTEEVLAWLDFVVNIIQHSHDVPPAKFQQLCEQEWSSPNRNTVDFLETIGCSDRTKQHYAHKLGLFRRDRSYALDVMRSEHQPFCFLSRDDPLLPLRSLKATTRAHDMSPAVVRAKIHDKFMNGAYGQFSSEFLEEIYMPLTAVQKERLTLG